jgi:hypothetical protein
VVRSTPAACCSAASASAGRVGVGQRGEHGQAFGAALLAAGREDVEHDAAADGVAGRSVAQDEAVAGQRADVTVDTNLRPVFTARRDLVGTEQAMRAGTSSAPRCRCTGVQCLSAGWPERTRIRASKRRSGACRAGVTSHWPRSTSIFSMPPERQRDALPGVATFSLRILHTQAAHADGFAGWREQQLVAGPTFPAKAVPVTTVPAPASVKQRSMARRKPPAACAFTLCCRGGFEMCAQFGDAFAAVAATGKIGAPASAVPASSSAISVFA